MTMKQVNIHDAKTHLSRLIAEAVEGRPFVIAKAGQPMVEVRAVPVSGGVAGRIGFLAPSGTQARVKDVDAEVIQSLFEGNGAA